MSKSVIGKFIRSVGNTFDKHSPEILLGLGIAGGITTTILASTATPKAVTLIRKAEMDKGEDEPVELTKTEIIKVTWKCYIPAAVSGVVSIACLLGSHSVNSKRNAALATAYKISEAALAEYKSVVKEEIGEEKAKEIGEKVMQKRLSDNPVSNREVIVTGTGTQLCYDGISGRYFESDINTIKAAVNKINETMVYEMYAALNDFYNELGLSNTEMGDMLGWNLDDGLLEISYGSMISDDGRPCITLEYYIAPRYDFAKLM